MAESTIKERYTDAWHGDEPYDAKEEIRLRKSAELLALDMAVPNSDDRYRVIDIGCGIGPLRRWLPRERFEIVGLEWSEDAAALCKKNYDDCLVASVEERWPTEDASFDGLHAGALLEHVFDWHAPLNEANRVLRDRGLLVVSVPNLCYWKELKRLVRGRQPHWMSEMLHIHAYTPQFLKDLVRIHGFEFESLEADRVNFPLLPKSARWVTRRFARYGSVMILSARKARRVRVEDRTRAGKFKSVKDVGLRSIEVLEA